MKSPQKLVKILIKSNFTQEQIAERANVCQSTISKILNNQAKNPRYSTVKALEDMVATLESLPEYDDEDNGEV